MLRIVDAGRSGCSPGSADLVRDGASLACLESRRKADRICQAGGRERLRSCSSLAGGEPMQLTRSKYGAKAPAGAPTVKDRFFSFCPCLAICWRFYFESRQNRPGGGQKTWLPGQRTAQCQPARPNPDGSWPKSGPISTSQRPKGHRDEQTEFSERDRCRLK